ncbi:hypothetical protein NEF87_000700 [Candidatus Lokiarchaeum ossiferum]|uniref:Flagellin n=1 Tax=Candidatus Lokiarchaeum ossiferum TaxID=2951803 RepID=A0ABY6HLM3_9ARCH|nr:hypothetical protein NEF87_000700 [Candidatus Lokiarchaeum sp. B-35]
MGQSVSISFGMLFLCTLLVGSMLYSAFQSSNELITEAQENNYDREFSRIHTSIQLINASRDPSEMAINLVIENIGTEIIYQLDSMDVFTNVTQVLDCGPYVYDRWIPSSNLGAAIISAGCYWSFTMLGDLSHNPTYWDPHELLNITITFNVTIAEQYYYYRISTPNGVGDSFIYNTLS